MQTIITLKSYRLDRQNNFAVLTGKEDEDYFIYGPRATAHIRKSCHESSDHVLDISTLEKNFLVRGENVLAYMEIVNFFQDSQKEQL
ncbi:MAG: hypothetical protein NE330_02785 [Lentisphaeraceae bacterium]|nr:hypothetical protein [Lentisphaeraceae bacterium]